MAGNQRNPGQPGKYVFRYQYLLVELGTDVLRKVFDWVVGYNVVHYLTTKSPDIQSLIKAGVLTADQKLLLSPINNKPDSSKFDITLLSCLLRNICGLSPPRDPVWINPASTDTSLEADIARLRMCRNQLMHSSELRLPKAEFESKWQDLSAILLRLNNVGGIAQLQSDINNVEIMEIDEQLREKLDKTLQDWHESDTLLGQKIDEVARDLGNVKLELVGVKKKLAKVELSQQEIKRQQEVDHTDIQKYLVDFYRRRCNTLPVSPLFKNKNDNLLSIYKYPTMCSVKCNGQETTEKKEMKCYEDLFCKDGRVFEEIYIVGDAGVGKTAFCRCMSFLWCYAKSDNKLEAKYKELQKDVEYMSNFEFVFYVSLRDTCHTYVVDMIIEQLFRGDKAKYQISIDTILSDRRTLVLMDGLDEWVPTQVAGNQTYELPDRINSKNCVYATTTRPYRIESVRLSRNDVDHQVEIKGISGESAKSYIEDVIQYMNKENKENRKLTHFTTDVKKCNLDDEICIPIIASHLVILWFEQTLTNKPRALIYAYILEMLFKRAEKRKVDIPSPTESKFQDLPKSLSGLEYLKRHVSLLYNVCHLSFRSLFKQDENATKLVFTVDQLQDKPYCFTDAETEFLCKIGILSKNEVFGCYSEEKLKISFIHKSYIEFFAALFISSSGFSQLFDTQWKLSFVLQSEHSIILLVGFFAEGAKNIFDNLYQLMSDDLSLCRRNAIFHYVGYFYQRQIQSLQDVVVKCFKKVNRSNDPDIVLKLEDFIFDRNSNVDILRKLLRLNTSCVKSICSVDGKYYGEFDQIKNLQSLHVGAVLSGDYVKFTECIVRNQSTLHTVCIKGRDRKPSLIPELPVRDLKHLTSLCLHDVKMKHTSLHELVTFLSDNDLIENIKLSSVGCYQCDDRDCTLTLNLQHHTKLTSLCLHDVNILCDNVNKSSLKYITLYSISKRSVGCFINVLFNCIKNSQLEHLYIRGSNISDYNTIKTLTDTVKTLRCIKSLTLWGMELPDDVLLQLHSDVTQVNIKLGNATMSGQYFDCYIKSCVNNKTVIKVELDSCSITSVDGETRSVKSWKDSVDCMSDYLTSIPTVNITSKDSICLTFETKSCH